MSRRGFELGPFPGINGVKAPFFSFALQNATKHLRMACKKLVCCKKNNIILGQVYDAIALNQSSVSRDIEVSLRNKSKERLDCNVQTIFANEEKYVLLEINTVQRQKNIIKKFLLILL